MLVKLLQKQKVLFQVEIDVIFIFLSNQTKFPTWPQVRFYSSFLQLSTLHLFIDVTKEPTESLVNVAAFDVDRLFSKASSINEGVLFNVQQSLLKAWGPESLGTLPEDTMQQLLTEVNILDLFPCFPNIDFLCVIT